MKTFLNSIILFFLISCQGQNKEFSSDTSYKIVPEHESITSIDTMEINKEIILGKFDPKEHPDFTVVPTKYADRQGLFLQKTVLDSFISMYNDAKLDGINLVIRSATRNFQYQRGIWERKWTGATTLSDGTNASKDIENDLSRAKKILEYSSMPGTSRHHWGTDIDLNAFNNAYFESGMGLKTYNWLEHNAPKYGFNRPYTSKKDGRTGYNEEKWHWSFTPISVPYTQYVVPNITYNDIRGFLGDPTAKELNVIPLYMLGVHHTCK